VNAQRTQIITADGRKNQQNDREEIYILPLQYEAQFCW
jgi:hypothetical protein